jgi:signal transduction histidine kinase
MIEVEARDPIAFLLAMGMALFGFVALLEYTATKITAEEAALMEIFGGWHSFFNFSVVMLTVWMGFLAGPRESTKPVFYTSLFAVISFTVFYAVLMGAQVTGDLRVDIGHHMVDGKWHFYINNDGLWSLLMRIWFLISAILLSVFFFIAYRVEKIVRLRQWKFALFILFSLIPGIYFLVFVYQAAPAQTSQYNISVWLVLALSLFAFIYTNFNLFNPVSIHVMDHLLDSVDSLVIVLDQKFYVSYSNASFQKQLQAFGVKRSKRRYFPYIMQKIGIELEDEADFIRQIRSLKQEQVYEQDLRIKIAGRQHHFFVTVTTIKGGKKAIKGHIIVGKDITQFKEDEARLKTYARQLEQSNEELERFTYIASHDLKTPVRNINSFANLLNRALKKKGQSEMLELSQLIINNATFMYRLIQNILEYSTVDKSPVAFEVIALNEVVELELSKMEALIQSKNAIVEYGDLPDAYSTRSLMGSLLYNLIENAIKFNENEQPHITIDAYEAGGMLTINISDNGIGIEPAYQQSIFSMFQRLHGYTDFRDTGVGLALCKRIVELHKGSIGLRSEVGKGSTFYFSIPTIPSPHQPDKIPQPHFDTPNPPFAL